MTYITVFDAARDCREAPWPWWVQALAFACFFVGAFYLRSATVRVFPYLKRWDRPPSISAWVGNGVFSFAASQMLFGSIADCSSAASTLREGRYSIIEGPVTEFDEHYGGVIAKGETFVVSGKRFTVSRYSDSYGGGFHHLSSEGGPIRDGLNVRIAYSGSEILRLEIAK